MIEFKCPDCAKQIRVKPDLAGRTGKCPGCGQKIAVPTPVTSNFDFLVRTDLGPQSAKQPPVVSVQPRSMVTRPDSILNVSPKSSLAKLLTPNDPGKTSLIIAAIAFLICWFPLVGFALSGYGLFLGIVGIKKSQSENGAGFGYSLAGTAVSSLGLLIGVLLMGASLLSPPTIDTPNAPIAEEKTKLSTQEKDIAVKATPKRSVPEKPTAVPVEKSPSENHVVESNTEAGNTIALTESTNFASVATKSATSEKPKSKTMFGRLLGKGESSTIDGDTTGERKWYQNGTLHKKSALDWRVATDEDKLATCADMVCVVWKDGNLKPEISQSLESVDHLRPYARELVTFLDGAFKANPDIDELLESQTVASTAVAGMALMGWFRKD
jgi:DNA-directed RNA polymerase subunit RPC12/RpoP